MGCYDTFIPGETLKCPFCEKSSIDNFQTKDFECQLANFRIGKRVKFYNTVAEDGKYLVYTSCDYCGAWVEAQVVIEGSIFIRFEQVGKLGSHKNEMEIEDDGHIRILRPKGRKTGGGLHTRSLKHLD